MTCSAALNGAEARGIVCWKIDRLARNPVDGGQVQWLLQQGVIQNIQTHDRSYLPNDNVLMMSVELGMANEYIRQLSANTSRGLKHKARMGIYPGLAPFGYINNPLTKSVNVERKNAKLIKKTFAMYAQAKPASKTWPISGRKRVSYQKATAASISRGCPSFCKILFITGTFVIAERYTRASMSRS